MKWYLIICLISLSFSAIGQDSPEKKPPSGEQSAMDNKQEQQQAAEEKTINDFEIGPYDREGKYKYYDRFEQEMKAAEEGRTQTTE